MGALNIRYGIAYIPHPRRGKVTGDSSPNSNIRIGLGKHPTQIIRAEHPSKTRPNLPTNPYETLGSEFT